MMAFVATLVRSERGHVEPAGWTSSAVIALAAFGFFIIPYLVLALAGGWTIGTAFAREGDRPARVPGACRNRHVSVADLHRGVSLAGRSSARSPPPNDYLFDCRNGDLGMDLPGSRSGLRATCREGPIHGVYGRVGSTNLRADAELIGELQRFARSEGFDEQSRCESSTRKPSTSEPLPSHWSPSANWRTAIWSRCAWSRITSAAGSPHTHSGAIGSAPRSRRIRTRYAGAP